MNELQQRINALDDATAVGMLRVFAQHALRAGEGEPEAEELRGLAESVGLADERPGEGDLARHALMVLALDDQYRPMLADMLERAAGPSKFGFVGGVLLVTACVAVLQTGFSSEPGPDGKRVWTLVKHGLDAEAFTALAKAVAAFFGKK